MVHNQNHKVNSNLCSSQLLTVWWCWSEKGTWLDRRNTCLRCSGEPDRWAEKWSLEILRQRAWNSPQSIQQPRRPPKANIGRAWQDVAVKNPNPMHQYTDWIHVLKYNCQNKSQTTEKCCNEGLIRELPPPSAASHFPVPILCMHFCCWFGNWIRHYFTDVLQSVLVDWKASGDELLQATWASQSDHWCTWSLERVMSWGAWKSCSFLRRSVP